MKPSGIVDLPLHTGRCPKWLFPLMKKLAGQISVYIVDEYGEDELLKRLGNPYWFQSLGCVLGFDWHSSGLTTTTCGALKEGISEVGIEIGVAGGKGKISRKAPDEIIEFGDKLNLNEKIINKLIKTSKLSAKVDNNLLQDGFQLYHHMIFFTKNSWAVIQQGMNDMNNYARRYHWIKTENLINEPHSGIISDKLTKPLNLIAKESEETRKCSLDLIKENPVHLTKYIRPLKIKKQDKQQRTLFAYISQNSLTNNFKLPTQHFPQIDADLNALIKAYEQQPDNYEELVLVKGMGQKNIRALALISHLVHGTELSWKDPVKYSFAHGGKDGWPYPINRKLFNENIDFLRNAVIQAKLKDKERVDVLKRLNKFYSDKIMLP